MIPHRYDLDDFISDPKFRLVWSVHQNIISNLNKYACIFDYDPSGSTPFLLGIVNGWLMAVPREGRRSQHIAHLSHEKLLHYAILHHPAKEASILTNQDQSVHAVSWCHSSPFFTFFYIIDWYQNMLREHIFLWAFASSMHSTCWWLVSQPPMVWLVWFNKGKTVVCFNMI